MGKKEKKIEKERKKSRKRSKHRNRKINESNTKQKRRNVFVFWSKGKTN